MAWSSCAGISAKNKKPALMNAGCGALTNGTSFLGTPDFGDEALQIAGVQQRERHARLGQFLVAQIMERA
jgi:hypothetical protein